MPASRWLRVTCFTVAMPAAWVPLPDRGDLSLLNPCLTPCPEVLEAKIGCAHSEKASPSPCQPEQLLDVRRIRPSLPSRAPFSGGWRSRFGGEPRNPPSQRAFTPGTRRFQQGTWARWQRRDSRWPAGGSGARRAPHPKHQRSSRLRGAPRASRCVLSWEEVGLNGGASVTQKWKPSEISGYSLGTPFWFVLLNDFKCRSEGDGWNSNVIKEQSQ